MLLTRVKKRSSRTVPMGWTLNRPLHIANNVNTKINLSIFSTPWSHFIASHLETGRSKLMAYPQ
jgi:hypothetical protein